MDRRRFLRVVGATGTVGSTLLAGCSGLPGIGSGAPSGERAGYDAWVGNGSVEDDSVSAFSLDLETFRDLRDSGEETTTETTTTTNSGASDPLIGIPATYYVGAAFLLGFGLSGTGLSSLVTEDGLGEWVHAPGEGIVIEGSFAASDVAASVRDADGSQTSSHEGYDLYEVGESVVALNDGVALVVDGTDDVADPSEVARRLTDVGAGRAERYSDTSNDYDALATALPNEGIAGLQYDAAGGVLESAEDESEEDAGSFSGLMGFSDIYLDGDAVGGTVSATFSTETTESTLAIRYASEADVDSRSDVEAAVGTEAASRSVTIDGQMVYIEGRYKESTPSDS